MKPTPTYKGLPCKSAPVHRLGWPRVSEVDEVDELSRSGRAAQADRDPR